MVCLAEFTEQTDLSVLRQYYKKTDTTPHVTKLLVDDKVIHINSVVLSLWSNTFSELRGESDEIFMEGFLGQADGVMECFDLLHGYQVEISYSNVQVILKFGLLYRIDKMTNLAEKWLQTRMNSTEIESENTDFVKILKIALKIEQFCAEYDYVFDICAEHYEDNREKCVHLMIDNFTDASSGFVRFLFSLRSLSTWTYSLDLLKMLPKSRDNNMIILEAMEDFIGRSDYVISDISAGFIALLESFADQTELSAELDKKLRGLHTSCLKTFLDPQVKLNNLICKKPWRNLNTMKDLIGFHRLNTSMSEYAYMETIIDWLKFNANFQKLISMEDKTTLLNSIQKSHLNGGYIKDKSTVFKKYDMPTGHFMFNNKSIEYPETKMLTWGVRTSLSQMRKLDFANIRLIIRSDNPWCKQDYTENPCKVVYFSLVPDKVGDKNTQIQVKVHKVEDTHSRCPALIFTRWILEFKRNKENEDYISTEISTYQDVEDFVKANPECEIKIRLLCCAK